MNSGLGFKLAIALYALAAVANCATFQASVDTRAKPADLLQTSPQSGRDSMATISEKLNSVVRTLEAAPYAGLETRLGSIESRLAAIEAQLMDGDDRVSASAARLLQTATYATTSQLASAVNALQTQILNNRTVVQGVCRNMVSSLSQTTTTNINYLTSSMSMYQNQTLQRFDAASQKVDQLVRGVRNETMAAMDLYSARFAQNISQMSNMILQKQAQMEQIMNQTAHGMYQMQLQMEAYKSQSMMGGNTTDLINQTIHSAIQEAIKQLGLGDINLMSLIQKELANLGLPANLSLDTLLGQAQAMVSKLIYDTFGPNMVVLQNITNANLAMEIQSLLNMIVPQVLANLINGAPLDSLANQLQQTGITLLNDFMSKANIALKEVISQTVGQQMVSGNLTIDALLQPLLATLHQTLIQAINGAISNSLAQALGPMGPLLSAPLAASVQASMQMALDEILNSILANLTSLIGQQLPQLISGLAMDVITQLENQLMGLLNQVNMIPMLIQDVQKVIMSQLQNLLPGVFCLLQQDPQACAMANNGSMMMNWSNITMPLANGSWDIASLINQALNGQLTNLPTMLVSLLNNVPFLNMTGIPAMIGQFLSMPSQIDMLKEEFAKNLVVIQNAIADKMKDFDGFVGNVTQEIDAQAKQLDMIISQIWNQTSQLEKQFMMMQQAFEAKVADFDSLKNSVTATFDSLFALVGEVTKNMTAIDKTVDSYQVAYAQVMAAIDQLSKRIDALSGIPAQPARLLFSDNDNPAGSPGKSKWRPMTSEQLKAKLDALKAKFFTKHTAVKPVDPSSDDAQS